jgi:hypothetical protein
MFTFLDGPAKGASLNLARAPLFLRVVIDTRDGKVDALDQLTDVPHPCEAIYVYRLAEPVSSGVMCSRGRGCARFVHAKYVLHDQQPTDEQARWRDSWFAWAIGQAERMPPRQLGDAGPLELASGARETGEDHHANQ